MKIELCEKCARPLWEGLCGYCIGTRKILNKITDLFIEADQREDRVQLSDIEKIFEENIIK